MQFSFWKTAGSFARVIVTGVIMGEKRNMAEQGSGQSHKLGFFPPFFPQRKSKLWWLCLCCVAPWGCSGLRSLGTKAPGEEMLLHWLKWWREGWVFNEGCHRLVLADAAAQGWLAAFINCSYSSTWFSSVGEELVIVQGCSLVCPVISSCLEFWTNCCSSQIRCLKAAPQSCVMGGDKSNFSI